MGKITYDERKKNSKLTNFEELKEAVVSNVIKHKDSLIEKKKFKEEENKTLGDFE